MLDFPLDVTDTPSRALMNAYSEQHRPSSQSLFGLSVLRLGAARVVCGGARGGPTWSGDIPWDIPSIKSLLEPILTYIMCQN